MTAQHTGTTKKIAEAAEVIKKVVIKTPLEPVPRLSEKFGAEIYFKREDQQTVRSYKIRGAFNTIFHLSEKQRERGVVCASAGNHAQGVALSCNRLKIKGIIFMPEVTPRQKINKVKSFGGKWVSIELTGTTFDEAYDTAMKYCSANGLSFVHPFDNIHTIAGQGTVAKEILDDLPDADLFIVPVGGGGLLAGMSAWIKEKNPDCKIIGVDPSGAPKMAEAFKAGKPVLLPSIDAFVDGAAVRQVGKLTFEIASGHVYKIITVAEGKVCSTMIELYQNEGIIAEPAGALSVAALEQLAGDIKGKKVVCVISGGNNDMNRYPEVVERSLIYEGLKHYLIIEFAQKPGELRRFLNKVLGPGDDIVRFEYLKKTNKEFGPALVGIELTHKNDFTPLLKRLEEQEIRYRDVTRDEILGKYFI
jgi:threonine dehydratase